MKFPNEISENIFVRTYSRWLQEQMRRETYEEMVDRVVSFYKENFPALSDHDEQMIRKYMLRLDVMPSMRLAWTAGEPARKCSIGTYNCSHLAIDSIHSFAEVIYLLLHGTGVGFNAQQKVVDRLPVVGKKLDVPAKIVVFEDSKEGWARGLLDCLTLLWDGYDVEYDVSQIRPEGAPLKTFGGRASGPQPLVDTLEFCKKILENARGRQLRSIEVHDIICKIAQSVVVGGVRRSALISLSDLDDKEMAVAKAGEFWNENPQRALANNSVAYNGRPSESQFWQEWVNLVASGSGERGIFNRQAALNTSPSRRKFSDYDKETLGTNPCAEILLKASGEFCNLTSVVVRPSDEKWDLASKVRVAAIMGTIQSSLDNFGLLEKLNPAWKENCEDERLLGVSLSGIMDHPTLWKDKQLLRDLKEVAVQTNWEYAKKMGIKQAAAVTTVKPEGTASTLNNSSSGFHARYAPYYIRHVRINATDPLYKMMRDQGVPFQPEVGQEGLEPDQVKTWVAAFPVASPENAITIDKLSAIDQLEIWKTLKENWAEHSVSATINVGQTEWAEVGQWVWDNFDLITGLSFLPRTDHVYKLAPFVPVSKEEYETAKAKFPVLDYSLLSRYEYEDHNNGNQQEWACVGNNCELL
jgi:ribonucleoside-diphosphate reductase alpha chain